MTDKKQIRVSYLITTRNRGQYLQRTLDNVREFITPEDELIVIDGGSTDDTVKILERNRDIVSFYLSEPDKSEAHAFNKGWRRARGKYLKPITDDDYFYPDAMRKMIETMEAHPEIDALQCGGECWKIQDGKEVFRRYQFLPTGIQASAQTIYDHCHIGLGLLLRTTTLEMIGGAAGNYRSVDGDLFTRMVECGCSVGYLDVNGYRWYVHPHSGFNATKRFEYEYLMMSIRMGRWHQLFGYNPFRLAELTGLNSSAGGVLFLRAMNISFNESFSSKAWRLRLCLKLRSALRKLRGLFHSRNHPSEGAPAVASEKQEKLWSGQLR